MGILDKVFGHRTSGTASTGRTFVAATHRATPQYKTASYASIPYERAPQVMDTVPTKGLLPGYSTPDYVWVA